MFTRKDYKSWRDIISFLRKEFPVKKLSIKRVKLSNEYFAESEAGDNTRIIRISYDLSYEVAVYFLMHEWAHQLCVGVPGDDHNRVWAIKYGEIIRKVMNVWLHCE